MADRKSFLLRLDPALFDALRRWADDELRSVNGQIEFLIQRALRDAGRKPVRQGKDSKNNRETTQEPLSDED